MQRCRTRIVTATGANYLVFEDEAAIAAQIERPWIELTSWLGSELMPPERLSIRSDHVVVVQEMSEEAWNWAVQANALANARQLSPSAIEQAAEAQGRMADAIARLESADE